MGLFSRWFGGGTSDEPLTGLVKVDMHSHLLPGIDDGVDDFEESLAIIKGMQALGYRKFITTPHIMSDFYRNSPEEILELRDKLREKLSENGIDVQLEAAAEYYLDEHFENQLKDRKLLTFGNNYVLVETSYLNPAPNINELIFEMKIAGYQPILAHPERYIFMYDDFEKYRDLYDREIFFQVNLLSLLGYYSKESKKISEQLVKEKMVHFIGSDIHHERHLKALEKTFCSSLFKQVTELELLNNSLL